MLEKFLALRSLAGKGGGSGGGSVDTDEIDKALDAINCEVIGETLYHVTFMNGKELIQVPVYEGYNCADPVATGLIEKPTREGTKYIAFTFAGWSLTEGGEVDKSALLSVEEDRTVYAVFAEEYIYIAKGTDTDQNGSLSWTLNPDYVLTVECNDYYAPSYTPYIPGGTVPPWWGYREYITSFVAKGSGRYIGTGWLYHCTNLTSVNLHSGIGVISIQAFAGCTALTSITLPSEIRIIGNHAFEGAALESITFPATTYVISKKAFNDCPLENVVFKRTYGWYYSENIYTDADNGTAITEAQVADTAFMLSLFAGNYTITNINLE